jgi:sugar fermentation stimulation protein A
LDELVREVRRARAVMLFVIRRTGCTAFDVAHDFDPAYAAGMVPAAREGVEVLCYDCDIGLDGVRLGRRAPWRAAP